MYLKNLFQIRLKMLIVDKIDGNDSVYLRVICFNIYLYIII